MPPIKKDNTLTILDIVIISQLLVFVNTPKKRCCSPVIPAFAGMTVVSTYRVKQLTRKTIAPSFLRKWESMILLVILSSSRVLTAIPANPSFLSPSGAGIHPAGSSCELARWIPANPSFLRKQE